MSVKISSPQSPSASNKRPYLPPIKTPMSPNYRDGSESITSASSHAEELDEHAFRDRAASTGTPDSQCSRSYTVTSLLNNDMDGADDQDSLASQDLRASRSPSNASPASSDSAPAPNHGFHNVTSSSSSPSPVLSVSRPRLPTTVGASRNYPTTTVGAPTGVLDARKNLFLGNPMPGVESQHSESLAGMGPDANGPSSPSLLRSVYPLSYQAVARIGGRVEGDTKNHFVHSQSNSPTTSYSSLGNTIGRATPPAPWSHNNHGLPTQLPSISTQVGPHISIGGDAAYGTSPGGLQNGVQMMTYLTNRGPTQIPVDVQAASKEADEKRKRNAGASARFRQRRKEKEREASQTISRLEGEVRKMGEERDSYRVERDYYRNIVQNHVHPHIIPRAPSPRQRRPSSSRSTSESPDWQQHGERGSDDGRNQRRRLSNYYGSQSGSHASSASPSEYTSSSGFPHARSDRANGFSPGGQCAGPTPPGFEGGWARPRV